MQILKLALSVAALLVAGEALAHKGSHAMPTTMPSSRLAPAQTDTNPAALLEGIGGRSAPASTATPGIAPQEPPAKSTDYRAHITRHH